MWKIAAGFERVNKVKSSGFQPRLFLNKDAHSYAGRAFSAKLFVKIGKERLCARYPLSKIKAILILYDNKAEKETATFSPLFHPLPHPFFFAENPFSGGKTLYIEK